MNCGSTFETPYCGQCGQEAAAAKLTLAELKRGVMRALSLERGWLRTFVGLAVRPGAVVGDYLEGKRVVYIAPFAYAITGYAVYLLVVSAVGMETTMFGMGLSEEFRQQVAESMATLVKWGMLAASLVRAGVAWLLFRRRGLTFAEHLAMELFIFGQSGLMYAAHHAVCVLAGIDIGYSNLWLIPCLAAYTAWIFRSVCARSAWSAVAGGMMLELVGLVAIMVFSVTGALVSMLFRFASANP